MGLSNARVAGCGSCGLRAVRVTEEAVRVVKEAVRVAEEAMRVTEEAMRVVEEAVEARKSLKIYIIRKEYFFLRVVFITSSG